MKNTSKISCIEYIIFNGVRNSIRRVNIKGFGEKCIAGESLQNMLLNPKDGAESPYLSDEAREIDEGIFFYVEDKYLNSTDIALAAKVEKELA